MLIAQTQDLNTGVRSTITQFRDNFPQSCEGFDEKSRQAFVERIDKTIKNKNKPDVHDFINYLCSADIVKNIYTLKKAATKKRPLSFERLSFVLLPLVKYLESTIGKNQEEIKKIQESLSKWISMVENNTNIHLNTKFEA